MTLKVTVGRTLMRTLLRVATTSVAAVATYYFVYWFGGALIGSILPGPLPNWIAVATSLLIAIFVTCYVWMQSGSSHLWASCSVLWPERCTGGSAGIAPEPGRTVRPTVVGGVGERR